VTFSFAHALGEEPFAPFLLFPMAIVLGYRRLKNAETRRGMLAHAEYNVTGLAPMLIPAFHGEPPRTRTGSLGVSSPGRVGVIDARRTCGGRST
jgi:hypothetical protein